MREDSSFVQLRAAFADSTGRVQERPGAGGPGRGPHLLPHHVPPREIRRDRRRGAPSGPVPYREGMTMRDADPPRRRGHPGRPARRPRSRGCPRAGPRGRWPRRCGCRSTPAIVFGRGAARRGGAQPRVPGRCAAPAVRQRAHPAPGRVGAAAHGGAQRPGEVPRPLLAPLQDRAARRPDRARRRTHRGGLPGRHPVLSLVPRQHAGRGPIGSGRSPRPTWPLATRRAAQLPERVGIDLPRVLENPKFRDNIILAAATRSTSPSTTRSCWCRER